jgi:hypothetical protein
MTRRVHEINFEGKGQEKSFTELYPEQDSSVSFALIKIPSE